MQKGGEEMWILMWISQLSSWRWIPQTNLLGSPAVHSVIFHLEVCIQDKGELAPETKAGEMGYKVRSAVKFDGNERKNENIE